jgi:hypothetical protein
VARIANGLGETLESGRVANIERDIVEP